MLDAIYILISPRFSSITIYIVHLLEQLEHTKS
jgi:hypothetical protein